MLITITTVSPKQPGRLSVYGAGQAPGADWQQADAQALPFDDEQFDLVACQFGVMFFPDKPGAFTEIRRVLTAGGRLRSLPDRSALVGDVRGSGLFIGVELVRDRETLEPAAAEASDVVNRLREEGILIGTDGPYHNVLKIRPPMPFTTDDADALASALETTL